MEIDHKYFTCQTQLSNYVTSAVCIFLTSINSDRISPDFFEIKAKAKAIIYFRKWQSMPSLKKKIVADFLLIMRQKSKLLSMFIKGNSIICVSMKEYAIAVI